MEVALAEKILLSIEKLPKKLRVEDAKHVIRAWLRASDLREDQWGNFALTVTDKERWQGVRGVRYHITERQLQRQVKHDRDWSNVASTPVIDAANALINNAAVALGKTELVDKAKSDIGARKDAVAQRKQSTEDKRATVEARSFARKYVAYKFRDAVIDNYTGKKIDEETVKKINEVMDFQTAFFKSVKTKPTDSMFASVDNPPVLPMFGPTNYSWVETVDSVRYTVAVHNKDGEKKASIQIGSSGGLRAIDPFAVGLSRSIMMQRNEGDGVISGAIVFDGKKFSAGLLLIMVRNDDETTKRKGVGTRLLRLWCRLMAGYGIDRWVAIAVGDEGAAFLTALEKKGAITIQRGQDSNWVVTCVR